MPPSVKVEKELERGANISIIALLDSLIEHANRAEASDIHIDPLENSIRVRFRIDGVLHTMYSFPKVIHNEIISRIKILSGLRTDEHSASQDGRFRSISEGSQSPVDIRVSIAPTYYGENAVLRILADKAEQFTLETLGFNAGDREKIAKAIRRPNGMILSTGPTGSGKTTTLYTLIKMLNTNDVSIITIEDPIEYSVEGVEQIQVNPRAGLTFANGLRSMLRQDPDIIMVGEIRDPETASIAVNSALTGHLLLSTLHTSDAATTLPRLLDLGVEAYLVASTVNIAIGQRLVRRICDNCKTPKKLTESEKQSLSEVLPQGADFDGKFAVGKGCDSCTNTGYHGRVGVNEVIVVDNEMQEAILKRASAGELRRIALKNGMTSMIEDGFGKAALGVTTIEEILRVLHD